MNEILTAYRSYVTSVDLNRNQIPFTPKGRYYGFDRLLANTPGIGDWIFGKISHVSMLRYLDGHNLVTDTGVAVTPQGVTYLCNVDVPIQIQKPSPPISHPNYYFYNILVMDFSWLNEETYNIPTLRVIPGPYLEGSTFSEDPYSVPGVLPTHAVLGVIRVSPGATNINGCLYFPADHPPFAGFFDLEDFARLSVKNLFTKAMGLGTREVLASNFYSTGSPNYGWEIYDSSSVRINLPNYAFRVNTITDTMNDQTSAFYFVHLIDITYFMLVPGVNIDIPSEVTFSKGDSFILLKSKDFKWKVLAGFDLHQRTLTTHTSSINSLLAQIARAVFVDVNNVFQKVLNLQQGTVSNADLVGGKLLLGPSSNHVFQMSSESNVDLKEIVRYVNSIETEYVPGDVLFISLCDTNNYNPLRLYLRPDDGDGFIINRKDLDKNTEFVYLDAGSYIFSRTNSVRPNYRWLVQASEGAISHVVSPIIWLNLIAVGDGFSGSGSWAYLQFYQDSSGLIHIRGKFTITLTYSGTLTLTVVNPLGISGVLKFQREHASTYGMVMATLSGSSLTFTSVVIPVATWDLQEQVITLP
jgi:hypothetical protein